VLLDRFPLVGVGLARLVQDVGVDGELADVVEERRPAQAIARRRRELELVGHEIGEGTDALGVTASAAIVLAESTDQLDDERRRLAWSARREAPPNVLDAGVEIAHAAGATGDRQARGCSIGEHQCHLEQGGQRQQPESQPGDPCVGERRERELADEPQNEEGD
jgi:hypothetical protein